MLRPAVLSLLLASTAVAQFPTGAPGALPGLPMVPPPVPHPGLAAQPLFDEPAEPRRPTTPAPGGGQREGGECPDPSLSGPQVAGRDLKKAVEKVKTLRWLDDLGTARTQAAATGKPIVWLQALGDLEGFA